MPRGLIEVPPQSPGILQNSLRALFIVGSADVRADLLPLLHHLTDGQRLLGGQLLLALFSCPIEIFCTLRGQLSVASGALCSCPPAGSVGPFLPRCCTRRKRRILRLERSLRDGSRRFCPLHFGRLRHRRNLLRSLRRLPAGGRQARVCCLSHAFCCPCCLSFRSIRRSGCPFPRRRGQDLQHLLCAPRIAALRGILHNLTAYGCRPLAVSGLPVKACQLKGPAREEFLPSQLLQHGNLLLHGNRRNAVHLVLQYQSLGIRWICRFEFLHELQRTRQILLQAVLAVQEDGQFTECIGDGRVLSVPLVRDGHDVTALMVFPDGLIDLADPAQRLRAFHVVPVNAVCDLRSLLKPSLADQRVDFIQAELKFVLIHFVFLVFHASETGLSLQLFRCSDSEQFRVPFTIRMAFRRTMCCWLRRLEYPQFSNVNAIKILAYCLTFLQAWRTAPARASPLGRTPAAPFPGAPPAPFPDSRRRSRSAVRATGHSPGSCASG